MTLLIPLAPRRWSNFPTDTKKRHLENFQWNRLQLNAIRHHRWSVNTGSGYGLVPSGNKSSPEAVLIKSCDTIWHHDTPKGCAICTHSPMAITSSIHPMWIYKLWPSRCHHGYPCPHYINKRCPKRGWVSLEYHHSFLHFTHLSRNLTISMNWSNPRMRSEYV